MNKLVLITKSIYINNIVANNKIFSLASFTSAPLRLISSSGFASSPLFTYTQLASFPRSNNHTAEGKRELKSKELVGFLALNPPKAKP